ncbi:uncharacterized protein LOC121721035 [Alosa sapidissima]|uniref:uncharacterized protein LOC121721035 n=1 Tax=Alosa sapidissima TaxID=34773 RepID=UPI001C0A52F3|nr:uncharacterized protein LOC121721035 [Alosa sapidissima]
MIVNESVYVDLRILKLSQIVCSTLTGNVRIDKKQASSRVYKGATLIELSIGSLVLALAVILKGINVEVHNPLNRERLTLLPYAALILLSGLCLLLPAIKPSPSLIRFNLYTHLVDVLFSLVCCGLVAKNTPYQSETSSTAGYSVNNILGILIGMSVLEFLLGLFIICYGFVLLPLGDSEGSPVPKPVSSTTTDRLCPTDTEPNYGLTEGETPDQKSEINYDILMYFPDSICMIDLLKKTISNRNVHGSLHISLCCTL